VGVFVSGVTKTLVPCGPTLLGPGCVAQHAKFGALQKCRSPENVGPWLPVPLG